MLEESVEDERLLPINEVEAPSLLSGVQAYPRNMGLSSLTIDLALHHPLSRPRAQRTTSWRPPRQSCLPTLMRQSISPSTGTTGPSWASALSRWQHPNRSSWPSKSHRCNYLLVDHKRSLPTKSSIILNHGTGQLLGRALCQTRAIHGHQRQLGAGITASHSPRNQGAG